MKYLAIKNFERFQHYKDRAPLWIKMHTSVLTDFALLSLPEAAQAQLFKLWILASRLDNRIPNDRGFLCAQLFTKRLYTKELIAAGFLLETDEPATPIRADWASRYVAPEVRARVLALTDGCCANCGSMENVEIDHIVPISRGGTGDESNLQALCRKCNRRKRTRTPAEQDATQDYADAEPREEERIEESEREKDPSPSSASEAEAEAGLAALLETDADRNALTAVVAKARNRSACLTAFRSMLTGNDPATPQPTPRVFGQALRDMAMNDDPPTANLFRGYLRRAAAVPPSGASVRAVPGARRDSASGTADRASVLLGRIKGMIRETRIPGQSTNRFIPKREVEALGADVLAAYEAVGGSERFLATDGDRVSYLIRDFTNALAAQEAAHV